MDDLKNPYATPRSAEPLSERGASADLSLIDRRRLATGLGLIYAGTVISIVVSLLLIAARFMPRDGGDPDSFFSSPRIRELAVAAVLAIAGTLAVIGDFYCLTASATLRARPFVLTAMIILTLAVVTRASVYLGYIPGHAIWAVGFLAPASTIAFLVFVRRLSDGLGREDFARRSRVLLVWSVIVCASEVLRFTLTATCYGGIVFYLTGGGRPIRLPDRLSLIFVRADFVMYWIELAANLFVAICFSILVSKIRGLLRPDDSNSTGSTDEIPGDREGSSSTAPS